MKLMKILLVLTVCLMAAAQQLTFDDPLKVYRADLVNSPPGTPLRGSMMGGAILAIQGTGFDAVGCNHQVLVGSLVCSTTGLPCSSETIMCQMPTSSILLENLPITVKVEGKGSSSCGSSSCLFSYSKEATPLITDLSRKSVIAGDKPEFIGYHKVENPGNSSYRGQVSKLLIGSFECPRTDSLDGSIDIRDLGKVSCQVPNYIEAGLYNVSERSYWGYADKSQHVSSWTFTTDNRPLKYDIMVHPSIAGMTITTGSTGGTFLVVGGYGYSIDAADVVVTAAGMTCVPSSPLTTSIIRCITAQTPATSYNDGKILNGSANRVKPYIAGAGAQIKKYDISALTTKTVAGIRADLALTTPVSTESSSGTTLSLREENLGSNVATVIKGYFKPPTTGSLKFSARSDSQLVLYVSSVYGTATVDYTTANLQVAGGSSSAASSASAITVANVEHHYYFELYHISSTAGGYFSVAAEISGGVTVSGAGAYEVQTVKIQAETLVKERLAYKQTAATGGTITFSLERNDSSTGLLTYSKTATVPFDATEAQFLAMLNTFDIFAPYSPSVTRTMKNEAGAVITTGTPYSITWAVQMSKWRPTSVRSQVLTINTSSLTATSPATPTVALDSTLARSHSSPVGGTMKLSIGGVQAYYYDEKTLKKTTSTDIPVTASEDSLRSSLAEASGCPSISIQRPSVQNSELVSAFVVSWTGCPGAKDTISTAGSTLFSGNEITVTRNTPGSNSLMFSPVSSSILRVPAADPQLTVTVNGVLSVCTASCSFTLSSPSLEVSAYTFTESAATLQVQTTDSATPAVPVTLSQIYVYLTDTDSVQASTATGTYTDFTVTLPKNLGNSANLEIGTYSPRVLFGTRQFARNAALAAASPIAVTMAITSVSPNTIPTSGGIELNILGRGFPSSKDKSGFSVIICGKTADVVSSETGKIVIVSPSCSDATTTATVTYKGTTTSASSSITVSSAATKPTITNISPTTVSPNKYTVITITGTNFDATSTNCRAFLTTGTQRKRIKELIWVSSTTTSAQFTFTGGIPQGDYKVVFYNQGTASSTEDITLSVKSTVTTVSPSQLTPYGGTIITITGANFVQTVSSYKVIIKEEDWAAADFLKPTNCTVTAVTSTTLACTMKMAVGALARPSATYKLFVIMDNQYVAISNCNNTQCTVTFPESKTVRTTLTTNIRASAGDAFTITGSNFVNPNSNTTAPQLWIGETQLIPTQFNNTAINITWPKLQSGSYRSYIKGPFNGGISATWTTTYPLIANGITFNNGSINGARTCITGKGLRPSGGDKTTLKVTGPTLVTYRQHSFSTNNDQLCLEFIASTPTASADQTITISYSYNGSLFQYFYNANYSKLMTLAAVDTNHEEPYQSSSITTLDFKVTTELNLTGIVPTLIAYYPVGTSNTVPFGSINTFEVVWDATSNTSKVNKTQFDTLKGNKYCFHLYVPTIGYTACAPFTVTPPTLGQLTVPSSVDASYLGGPTISIANTSLATGGSLEIASLPTTDATVTAGSHAFTIPGYTYVYQGVLYNNTDLMEMLPKEVVAANSLVNSHPNDDDTSTDYYDFNSICKIYLKYDRPYLLRTIRLFVPYSVSSTSFKYSGIEILGTNDADHLTATYTTIHTLASTIINGWNTIRIDAAEAFKTFVIRHGTQLVPQTSDCRFSQISLFGYPTGTETVAVGNINDFIPSTKLAFSDSLSYNLNGIIHYKLTSTPTVTDVSPRYGSWKVTTTVTVTGSGFGTTIADVSVKIDDVVCTVTAVTNTQITCTAPLQSSQVVGTPGKFVVRIAGRKAYHPGYGFKYVSLWMQGDTWGAEDGILPLSDVDVTIPAGKTVLFDHHSAILGVLTIEGTLIISQHTSDITFSAKTIVINKGTLIVGHEKTDVNPLTNKVTIKLTGKREVGKVSKAIVCNSCTLNLYGNVVNYPYSRTATTTTQGSITLQDNVAWSSAQEVVVGPSLLQYDRVETKTVQTFTAGTPSTIDLLSFLTNIREHTTTIGTIQYDVGAEVALKNRNVMITGETDSADPLFGARIIVNGPLADLNKRVVIRDVQMLGCGQVYEQMGSCIHFNNNGDAAGSSVERVIAGDTNSRMLTLTVVRHLKVSQNVGYNVLGHGIVLETGAEYSNQIEGNLLMRLKSNPQMGGTDVTPAGIWLSNPDNQLSGNIVSGSDSDGIVYSLSRTSSNSGYSRQICPEGIAVSPSGSNIIHSCLRYGLKIENYVPRKNPCAEISSSNPAVEAMFSNFLISSTPIGVYAYGTGEVNFDQFTIGDNKKAAIWFEGPNRRISPIIVSQTSFLNTIVANDATMTHQIYVPPKDGAIKFVSCKHGSSLAQTIVFDYTNRQTPTIFDTAFAYEGSLPTGQIYKLKWDTNKTNVVYDETGSLAFLADGVARANGAVFVPSHPHLLASTVCPVFTNSMNWDPTLLCDDNVSARTVTLNKAVPTTVNKDTNGAQLRILHISTASQSLSSVTSSTAGLTSIADQGGYWKVPMLSGKTYAVWWDSGADLKNLSVSVSPYYSKSSQDAVILRFNYTIAKQVLQVARVLKNVIQSPLITASGSALDPTTCNFGDYYHDSTNKFIFVCVSDKSRTVDQFRIGALDCVHFCDDFVDREDFVRNWSNATQWPGGVLPAAGADVTIPANQTVKLDMANVTLGSLIVEGNLFVEGNAVIEAAFIWIQGKFWAGNASNPYTNSLTIRITGTSSAGANYTFGDQSANKLIVVTGSMTLYAAVNAFPYSVLADKVTADQTTAINLDTASFGQTLNWAADDEIIIAPSFSPLQYSFVTAASVTATSVTPKTDSKPTYTHYGKATSNTPVDMRSMVGHLTRKIKIVSGTNTNNYGFRVLVTTIAGKKGSVTFHGVQFVEGGQPDSEKAALHFQDTTDNSVLSLVEKCSFVKCSGNCLRLVNNANVTINMNVFAEGRKFMVYVDRQKAYRFTNNLMIGARVSRSLESLTTTVIPEEVACYYQPTSADLTTEEVNLVSGNGCFGSHSKGFVIPLNPCSIDTSVKGFSSNTASVSRVGFFLNGQPDTPCQSISYLYGFNNKIGLITNPPKTNLLKLSGLYLSDNELGASVRQGYGRANSANITTIIENSIISTAVRSDCTYCYGALLTNCAAARGIRYASSTFNGKTLINGDNPADIDQIDSPSAYDSKLFLFSVEFKNFKSNHTGNISTCNGKVFEINSQSVDSQGSINLIGSTCTNCQLPKSLVTFPSVPTGTTCGDLPCSGLANYYIRDFNRTFASGSATFYVPNNSVFASSQGCVANIDINGHLCSRNDISVLQFESISRDYDSRTVWPVTLSYDTEEWTSVLNAPKKWDNFNRVARFAAMLITGKRYQLSFANQPPSDLRFSIQQKSNITSTLESVVLDMTYQVTNVAARVSVSEFKQQPFLASDGSTSVGDYLSTCGANKYFKQNGTISFVVTNSPDCQVRIKLVSAVMVTTTLATDIASFNLNGGVDTLRKAIAKFLNVTEDRITIIKVTSGSTIVDYYVTEQVTSTVDNSTSEVANQQQTLSELQQLANQIQSSGTQMDTDGLGSVVGVTTTVNVINADGSSYTTPTDQTGQKTKEDKTGLIVGLVVGILGAIALAVGAYFLIKKYYKSGQPVESHNISSEKIHPSTSEARGIKESNV